MPHPIANDLKIIDEISSFLTNILIVNNSTLVEKFAGVHPENCSLQKCPIKIFLKKYRSELGNINYRISKAFEEIDPTLGDYLSTLTKSNIELGERNSYSKGVDYEKVCESINNHWLLDKNDLDAPTESHKIETNQSTQNKQLIDMNLTCCSKTLLNDRTSNHSKPVIHSSSPNIDRTTLQQFSSGSSRNDLITPKNAAEIPVVNDKVSDLLDNSQSTMNAENQTLMDDSKNMNFLECSDSTFKTNSKLTPELNSQNDTIIHAKMSTEQVNIHDEAKTMSSSDSHVSKPTSKTKVASQDSASLLKQPSVDLNNNNNYEISNQPVTSIKTGKSIFGAISNSDVSGLSENQKISNHFKLNRGNYYKCWITHVTSPLLFWIQLRENQKTAETLETSINRFYSDVSNNEKYKLQIINESAYYACQFSVDNLWYRVKTLSINTNEKTAIVFYLDYGNTEQIPFDNLRHLDNEFYNVKRLAVPLSLSNASPVNGKWNETEVKKFTNLALNRSGEVYLKSHENWPILFCKLTVNIEKNGEKLVKDALKYLVEKNIVKQMKNNQIASDYRQYFQYLKYYTIYNTEVTKSPSVEVDESEAKESKAENLTNKNASPSKASEVSLLENGWHRDDFEFDPKNLAHNLIELDENSTFKFRVINIIDPSEFYVNNKEIISDQLYVDMHASMNDHYYINEEKLSDVSTKLEFLFPNSLCIVRSSFNNIFYRAIILSVHDGCDGMNITVHFIDHGVNSTTEPSRVYPFLKIFCYLPPLCIQCKLHSIKPIKPTGWSKAAIDFFKSLIDKENINEAIVANKVANKDLI